MRLISVNDGDAVVAGQVVANWDPHTHPIVTEVAGTVKFHDFIDGVTVNEQVDDEPGCPAMVVTDPKQRGAAGKDCARWLSWWMKKARSYTSAGIRNPGARYFVAGWRDLSVFEDVREVNGQVTCIGTYPAGIIQRPVTLPVVCRRVADLFEARKPKEPAILAEAHRYHGRVLVRTTKGKQRLVITDGAWRDSTRRPDSKWRHV